MSITKNADPVCAAPTRLEINRRTWADGSYFNPPQDGTPIVAIGRVIGQRASAETEFDDDPLTVTSVELFHGFVRWEKDDSGYEGWHFIGSGMVVAMCLDDKVKIDWWNPLPVEVA